MLYTIDIDIQIIRLSTGGKMIYNVFAALGIAVVVSLLFVIFICIMMIFHDKREEYRLKKTKKSKKGKKVNKR